MDSTEESPCGESIVIANIRGEKGVERVEVSMGRFIEQVGMQVLRRNGSDAVGGEVK